MNRNPSALFRSAVIFLLGTASAALAQVEISQSPGSVYSYIYNPLEALEFPEEALDTGDTQLVYLHEEANSTAYLYSVPGTAASLTWHFELTEPGAVWSADARVRADVLTMADALEDREAHYWLMEYSTDGIDYVPFFSTRASDAGEPYFWPGGTHSSTGPFFLDRGGFEGGATDLYIRITAENGTDADGNQMQAFRTDSDNNRQFEFNASVVDEADAAAVNIATVEAATILDQATDDGLNGIVGELSDVLHETSAGGAEAFTDAESATDAGGNIFWHPDSRFYHITWDLGTDIDPSARQLDEISVWIDAHDDGRRGYRGAFYTSMDGVEFRQVDGTAYGDRLVQGGSGGSPHFNNVRYTFAEGSVTGFRYLRFVSHGQEIGADYLAQSRFVEIDAWFSTGEDSVGFAKWRDDYFSSDELENENISGPEADADGDGIANLLEYVLGAEPREASRAALPSRGTEDGYLTLTFTVPAEVTDVTLDVQTAGEVFDWESNAVLLRDDEGADGATIYTYRDAVLMSEEPRRFMRLQVNQD